MCMSSSLLLILLPIPIKPKHTKMVFTCNMEIQDGSLIVHSNQNDTYIVVVNPRAKWLVAVSSPSILGDGADIGTRAPFRDARTVAELRALRSCSCLLVERWKALSIPIYAEYKTLYHVARSHGIPPHAVRVIITDPASEQLFNPQRSIVARMTTATSLYDAAIADHFNSTGALITSVLVNDIWPRESYADYLRWFEFMHPEYDADSCEDEDEEDNMTSVAEAVESVFRLELNDRAQFPPLLLRSG
jgi:hypothetical protein